MLKKILFPVISAFLLYRSILLTEYILQLESDRINVSDSFLYALFLTLLITGIFAFPGFAYPTGNLLPDGYYKIHHTRRLKRIYGILGVKYFRYLLMIFFWGQRKNRRKYFDGTRNGIDNLVYQSRQSEFGHLASFVCVFLLGIGLLYFGYLTIFLFLIGVNILANLYPVILQRHHRMRVERIMSGNQGTGNGKQETGNEN